MDETWAYEWIENFTSAWIAADTEVYVELFTEDAVCLFNPYGPAVVGRDALRTYVEDVVKPNPVHDVQWGKILVAGSHVAAEWWATLNYEGEDITLPGGVMMHFGGGGRCDRWREYCNVKEGRHEPPPEWLQG